MVIPIERLIHRPVNGLFYKKYRAVQHVVTHSVRGTARRRQMIEQMAKEGCVPSKSALYDVVSRFEKGEVVKNDDWGGRGKKRKQQAAPRRSVLAFKKSCPPHGHHSYSLETKGEWMGCIKLQLAVITLGDMDIKNNCALYVKDEARFGRLIRKHLKEEEDICTWIGWKYPYIGEASKVILLPIHFPSPSISRRW